MHRVLSLILILVWPGLAAADPRLDRLVNGRELQYEEARFVQAALARNGHYAGSLDGAWGPGSQAALARWSAEQGRSGPPTVRDLARIARNFETVVEREGWAPFHDVTADLSYLVPMKLTARQSRSHGIAFAGAGRSIEIASSLEPARRIAAMHEFFVRTGVKGDPAYKFPYTFDVTNRGLMAGGGRHYFLRSQQRGDNYATVVLQWAPDQSGLARLVTASITRGAQPPLALPPRGLLHDAIAALDLPGRPTIPRPDKDTISLNLRGTGVYVNNTDILTALGVMRDCKAPALRDGTRLRRIVADWTLGVAVFTSSARSPQWLVFQNGKSGPAQPVSVAGFAGIRRGDQEARITRGMVIGDTVLNANGMRLVLRLDRTDGNAGAPVFDMTGRLSALVTAPPLRGGFELGPGQALATPIAGIAQMLERERILHDGGAPGVAPRGMAGLNAGLGAALVPLFCKS